MVFSQREPEANRWQQNTMKPTEKKLAKACSGFILYFTTVDRPGAFPYMLWGSTLNSLPVPWKNMLKNNTFVSNTNL